MPNQDERRSRRIEWCQKQQIIIFFCLHYESVLHIVKTISIMQSVLVDSQDSDIKLQMQLLKLKLFGLGEKRTSASAEKNLAPGKFNKIGQCGSLVWNLWKMWRAFETYSRITYNGDLWSKLKAELTAWMSPWVHFSITIHSPRTSDKLLFN